MTALLEAPVLLPGATTTAARSRSGGATARKAFFAIVSALVSIVVLIGAWWLFLRFFDVDHFIGRRPADVWRYLFDGPTAAANRSAILDVVPTTLRDAFVGLLVGTVAGVVGAMLFTLSRTIQQTFMPMAMVLQAVPLIAIVPLITLIFGRGLACVLVITGIVTFFPTLVNVALALRNVPPQSMELISAYGGNPYTSLRKVQLPYALPALFAALRIAAPLSLIAALLAEWLATNNGLGNLMHLAAPQSDFDKLWAAAALVTAFSVILFGVISALQAAFLARFNPEAARS